MSEWLQTIQQHLCALKISYPCAQQISYHDATTWCCALGQKSSGRRAAVMLDANHQKLLLDLQTAAELWSTIRYAVLCRHNLFPHFSFWVSVFFFFPKPMRFWTAKWRTLSEDWNSQVLTYFTTYRDRAGIRMLRMYTSRNMKAGEWRRERSEAERSKCKGEEGWR